MRRVTIFLIAAVLVLCGTVWGQEEPIVVPDSGELAVEEPAPPVIESPCAKNITINEDFYIDVETINDAPAAEVQAFFTYTNFLMLAGRGGVCFADEFTEAVLLKMCPTLIKRKEAKP